jgi:hypothetical protein
MDILDRMNMTLKAHLGWELVELMDPTELLENRSPSTGPDMQFSEQFSRPKRGQCTI